MTRCQHVKVACWCAQAKGHIDDHVRGCGGSWGQNGFPTELPRIPLIPMLDWRDDPDGPKSPVEDVWKPQS